MGDSDDGDCLSPPPSSSYELSSFLRQILSRTPTTQPSSPPKRIVTSAETFPSVAGEAGSGVADIDHEKCVFENKRSGARQRNLLKSNIDAQLHNLSEKTLAVMNGLGLNPMRLPPVLPPTQTRINETAEPGDSSCCFSLAGTTSSHSRNVLSTPTLL